MAFVGASFAAPDGAAAHCSAAVCAACEEPREITVKNTFLHLSAPHRAARRCNSVPSSARLAGGADGFAKAGWGEVSTASEWDSDDRESVGSSASARGSAALPSDISVGADAADSRSVASELSGGDVLEVVPAAALPADAFLRQLTVIVAAALAALAGAGPVFGAMASDGPRGVSLVAQIRPEHLHLRELILTTVKEALLQAAAVSENVYVLGYLGQPFERSKAGFAATLGVAPAEAEACWDVLKKGSCCRGKACRWKHPAQQRTLNVMIQVALDA